MKRTLAIFIILTMSCLLFATENYSKKEQGTYIPVIMYEALKSSKSYSEGINLTSGNFYTILCVTEKDILSNIKFHDAFTLKDSKIDFTFTTKKGNDFIIDNKTGNEYIKISDSTNYYSAYDDFLEKTVLKAITKVNKNLKLKNSKILFNGEEWKIDKDQWHYSGKVQIILYSETSKSYIGFVDFKAYTLTDGEGLIKILDSEIKDFVK